LYNHYQDTAYYCDTQALFSREVLQRAYGQLSYTLIDKVWQFLVARMLVQRFFQQEYIASHFLEPPLRRARKVVSFGRFIKSAVATYGSLLPMLHLGHMQRSRYAWLSLDLKKCQSCIL
jgi:hypothetical protein